MERPAGHGFLRGFPSARRPGSSILRRHIYTAAQPDNTSPSPLSPFTPSLSILHFPTAHRTVLARPSVPPICSSLNYGVNDYTASTSASAGGSPHYAGPPPPILTTPLITVPPPYDRPGFHVSHAVRHQLSDLLLHVTEAQPSDHYSTLFLTRSTELSLSKLQRRTQRYEEAPEHARICTHGLY